MVKEKFKYHMSDLQLIMCPSELQNMGKKKPNEKNKVYHWKKRTLIKITIIELPEIDEDVFFFFPSINLETGFMEDAIYIALKQRLKWG